MYYSLLFEEIQYTMGETRGAHSIDIAINSGDESSKPCIFEVPAILRRHSPKSFTPKLFSIGPLHYKKEYLNAQKKAEKIKQHYLNNLLTRKPTPQTTREDFKRSILEVEEKARQCYDVPFDHISEDEFVDMLVLDGCFIIEFLRNSNNKNWDDDPVFSVSWVLQGLCYDLILLENQIPWFVLVRLFDMTTSPTISGSTKLLTDLALDFISTMVIKWSLPKIEGINKSNHILDLLRNTLVSPSTEKNSHKCNNILDLIRNTLVSSSRTRQELKCQELKCKWQVLPTATSLKELGIRFESGRSSKFLNIKLCFKNGVLAIPPLVIDDTTFAMLRNLISYEQCYPNCEARVTSYAMLLNNLITTPNDIEVLHEAGIVDNWLNPNDTLEFFKNVHADTYVKGFYYKKIFHQVNEYTNRWWPRKRAAYVRMFRDPIGWLSLFAAAIALILTLLQTLFTIL